MNIQEFSLGDSIVHRFDPRTKILATLVLSITVTLMNDIGSLCLAFFFPITLLLIARVSVRQIFRRLIAVNLFALFMWFVLPFTVVGGAEYSLGPFTIYRDGLLSALRITLRSNVIILSIMALLGTSPIFNVVHALEHLGIPNKLAHLYFLCFRYVHVIGEEYQRLRVAMKCRGFKPGTDLHTYRTYAYLMGMLLVRSFDRADRIMAAMKCRGFKQRLFIIHHYEMRRNDYVFAAVSMLFVTIILAIR